MRRILRDERGMALAVAIFALVVVGALVAGAFFAGTQERMLAWDPSTQNRVKQYPESSVAIANTAAPNGTGTYNGTWYRMGPNIFLLDITGQDTRTVNNQVTGGVGQIPTGWASCDPPGPSQAGVRDNGGTVGTSGAGTVNGSPPVVNDPSINSSTFTTFGGATYAQLAARATITHPGGNINTDPSFNADGSCNKNDINNWGDPHNPASRCGNYFPIIHVAGSVIVNNTQGQGILLVDGDLTVNGSWDFYGIVIIQGDLKTAGGGTADAHFWGGVMAKNADLSTQNLNGHATLNFSSCSILAALQAQSPISPMRQRGWVQLF